MRTTGSYVVDCGAGMENAWPLIGPHDIKPFKMLTRFAVAHFSDPVSQSTVSRTDGNAHANPIRLRGSIPSHAGLASPFQRLAAHAHPSIHRTPQPGSPGAAARVFDICCPMHLGGEHAWFLARYHDNLRRRQLLLLFLLPAPDSRPTRTRRDHEQGARGSCEPPSW